MLCVYVCVCGGGGGGGRVGGWIGEGGRGYQYGFSDMTVVLLCTATFAKFAQQPFVNLSLIVLVLFYVFTVIFNSALDLVSMKQFLNLHLSLNLLLICQIFQSPESSCPVFVLCLLRKSKEMH